MLKKKAIVIADDNANIRLTLKDILTDSGYVIDTVKDGYELVAYLKKSQPQLVILDLIMPEKDGIEVFDCLKCLQPETKVIIYTAYQKYTDSLYARRADRFVLKNSPVQELLEAIKDLI
ncbi:MAG: hypothetical protein A3J51_05105 [Omnitrophica WOR_2 bacterium RIFCSPHIGHO2_02_FULL_45_21]|nr:MAG: hypothetical protein A3J51_05105 [Omnitrophica WOR_2 bacterium RIFCSPHIGHO2_02_FULL_45_21]